MLVSKILAKIKFAIVLGLLGGLLLAFWDVPSASAATLTVCPDGSCDYTTIQAAVTAAVDGDVISVGPGTYAFTTAADRVTINKNNLTIQGAGRDQTFLTTLGAAGNIFQIYGSGNSIRDLSIEKLDNLNQVLVYVQADNFTFDNNLVFGHYVHGSSESSRAMVASYGSENLTITNNIFHHLRQPGYFNGSLASPTTGPVSNNLTYYTKGWVIDGANFTFSNNTWGTGADANIYDIAILAATPGAYYPDIVAISNANHDAVVEDQRVTPNVLSIVSVDASYTGEEHGGRLEPYTTISAGVARVVSGGRVEVADGTYIENVVIDKALELAGESQAGVIVLPDLSGPTCASGSICPESSNVLLVQASNVTIHDLTVDGDNPALTSGVVRSGADLDARNGIMTNHPLGTFQNLTVYNTTVKNIYLRGIYASSGGSFNIHHNTVENIRGDSGSIAIMNFVGSGTIEHNTVLNANDAIASNNSSGTIYRYNTVTGSDSGIHSDNNGSGGILIEDVIQFNTVSDCSGSWPYGIWVFYPYVNVVVDQNTVSNCHGSTENSGAALSYARPANLTAIPTFTNNTVTGSGLGFYATTGVDWGWGGINTTLSLSGNLFSGNDTGIYFEADTGFSLIATVRDNAFHNNLLNAATTGRSTGYAGTYAIDASRNWWGTPDPMDLITSLDDPAPRVIDYTPWFCGPSDTSTDPGYQPDYARLCVDDDSPQTGATTRIQEAIDLLTPGGMVDIAAGEYLENQASYRDLVIQKSLSLHGAGSTQTFVKLTQGKTNGVEIYGSNLVVALEGINFTRRDGSDYGPGFAVRVGETSSSFESLIFRDVDVSYGYGRNVNLGANGTYALLAVENSAFHHAGAWGFSIDGPASAVMITGSSFDNNGTVDVTHGIGLDFSGAPVSNVTVVDSQFNGNTSKGINASNIHGARFTRITASNNSGHAGQGHGFSLWEWTGGSSNILIEDSLFSGNARLGIMLGAEGDQQVTGFTIRSSQLIDNGEGALIVWDVSPNLAGYPDLTLDHNRIVGNANYGIGSNQLPVINAEDNWWGCNGGVSVSGCNATWGAVDSDPWLVLSVTPDPASILPGADSLVTADLIFDNYTESTSATGYVPDGISVAFNAPDGGSIDPLSGATLTGAAGTTFSAPVEVGLYQVCATVDNQTVCGEVEVENVAPLATGEAYDTLEDTPLSVPAPGVLANDSDENGDALSAVLATAPANGDLVLNADGSFDYTPNLDFNGTDSFSYVASDGELESSPATVTITVTPVNDAPVAFDQALSTPKDTPLAITLTAEDVDGDALTWSVLSAPALGTLSGVAPNLTYSPPANWTGEVNLTFLVNDGLVNSNTATVTITVTPANSAPVASDQALTTPEDTSLEITLSATDADGDTLTFTVVSQPAEGALSGTPPALTYTPPADWTGEVSFTFQANDGELDSNIATVMISVGPVNDWPTAEDDFYTVEENGFLQVAAPGVLENDRDIDGDSLSAGLISEPLHGVLTLNADGSFSYAPDPDFEGTDSFVYQMVTTPARTNAEWTDEATVTITVTPLPFNYLYLPVIVR